MDKYQVLRDKSTNAPNYDLETEDIIKWLSKWDAQYGISIDNVEEDALDIFFLNLPEDLTELSIDIYKLCPDIIDQHFGCIGDLLEEMEASEQDIPENFQEFVKDIDFNDENYGFELLKRSLALNKSVGLWWD
ncbi:DUF4253 domain-containing protein [Pseudanabaena sp. 'Roaring Creek']|uniref:DUF4253 domain-containing protein n=1 Tax=Pseudanabaena sp. 'Roaring Creek' TaxID=1681830 RepID=UPI0006D838D7|nr:DUF4253 domain-containing protein [Pseudanabaena sp. 'Roaring Creek']